jgi:organic radical activating enzyme
MNNKTFCIAPWTQVCVFPTGKLSPCCNWKGETELDYTQYDQWINSQVIKNARQSLHRGEKISACSKCWTDESAGKKSLRQIYNVEFAKYFDFSKLNDQWTILDASVTLDLKLGNLCNLKCVMCSGASSSQLMSEFKTNLEYFQKLPYFKVPPTEVDFSWPLDKKFKTFLDRFKNQLRWIKFTGGEPTLIPYVHDLLNSIDNPELVTVSLTTNATQINSRLLDTLAKFKKIWISVSLEGIGKDNDQIRYLSHWDEVEKNILKYKNLTNTYFNINHVLQCFSVVTLIPLLQWCEKHQMKLGLIRLTDPTYLHINSVSPDIALNFVEQLSQLKLTINNDVKLQVLQFFDEYCHNAELEDQMRQYINTLDGIRGTNLNKLLKG